MIEPEADPLAEAQQSPASQPAPAGLTVVNPAMNPRDTAMVERVRAERELRMSQRAGGLGALRVPRPPITTTEEERLAAMKKVAGTASDFALLIPRGVEGFAQGLWEFTDSITTWAGVDVLPDWHKRVLGRGETWPMRMAEDFVELGVGYGPVSKLVTKGISALAATEKVGGAIGQPVLRFLSKEFELERMAEARIQGLIREGRIAEGNRELAGLALRKARTQLGLAWGSRMLRSNVAGGIEGLVLVPGDEEPTAGERGTNALYSIAYGVPLDIGLGAVGRLVRIVKPNRVPYGPPPLTPEQKRMLSAPEFEAQVKRAEAARNAEKPPQNAPGAIPTADMPPGAQTQSGGLGEAPGASPGGAAAAAASPNQRLQDLAGQLVGPEEATRIVQEAYAAKMTNPAVEGVAAEAAESAGNVATGRFNPRELTPEQRVLMGVIETGINTRWYAGRARGPAEMHRVMSEFSDMIYEANRTRPFSAAELEDLSTLADLTRTPKELFATVFEGSDADLQRRLASRLRVKRDMMFGVSKKLAAGANKAIEAGDDLALLVSFEDIAFGARLQKDIADTTHELAYGLASLRTTTTPENFGKAKSAWVKSAIAKEDTILLKKEAEVIPTNTFLRVAPDFPAEKLAGDSEAIAARLNQYGGKDKVRKIVQAMSSLSGQHIPDLDRAVKVADALNELARPSLLDIPRDHFMFSIFSGPRSWMNTAYAQGAYGIAGRPLFHASAGVLGGMIAAASGNKEALFTAGKEFVRGLGEFYYIFHPETWRASVEAGWSAFKRGEGIAFKQDASKLADGSIGAVNAPRVRQWFVDNGYNPDGVLAVLAQSLGGGIRATYDTLAKRPFIGIDEATKQMVMRITGSAEAMIEGLFDKKVSFGNIGEYVRSNQERFYKEGRLRTTKVIYEEAYDEAVNEAKRYGYTNQSTVNRLAEQIAERKIGAAGDDLNQVSYMERRMHEAALTTPLDPKSFGGRFNTFVNGVPGLRFVAPIIRTAWNSGRLQAQPFDAAGLAKGVIGQAESVRLFAPDLVGGQIDNSRLAFARDLVSQDPRIRYEALGRMVTAMTAVTAVGHFATQHDDDGHPLVTGAYPKNPAIRNAWITAKIPEYSMLIGGSYYSYRRLEPVSGMIGFVANFFRALDDPNANFDEEELGSLAGAGMTAAITSWLKPSFVWGVAQVTDALGSQSGAKAVSMLENFAATMAVPNFVKQSGELAGLDPVWREVHGLWERIQSRTPGLSDNLEPRRNRLGEPVPAREYTLGSIASAEPSSDPVDLELFRLQASLSDPKKRMYGMDLTQIRSPKGQTAYDRWGELSQKPRGADMSLRDALRSVVKANEYGELPLFVAPGHYNARATILSSMIEKYRAAALDQMMREPGYEPILEAWQSYQLSKPR